ncbi:DNase I-like protein [Phellopilus nigrolimitatus]|nr:DNase I-like protein [Phellopilus nigrolimitatus]
MELEELEDILKDYLRPSELVKSILITHIASSSEELGRTRPEETLQQRTRILAIVSNYKNDEEEGSHELVLVQSIFALRSVLLTLDYEGLKQTYSTESSEELRVFMNECRRLIKVANTAPIPPMFPRPDLRKIQKAAYTNLSPASAGRPGDEDTDIALIHDDWLRSKLVEDRDIYTKEHMIRIRIGTFNVNGKAPSQDLSPWVRPQHQTRSGEEEERRILPPLNPVSPLTLSSSAAPDYLSSQESRSSSLNNDITRDRTKDDLTVKLDGDPDMIVLGFQELDLSAEALLYSYTTAREDMWLESIFAALGELVSKQLVGMLIICMVKKDVVKNVTDGNKGATALRLTLYSTVLTFVNAHLAAFDDLTERRNADFHDLSRRLLFSSVVSHSLNNSTAPDAESSGTTVTDAETVFQSDILFWMVSTSIPYLVVDLVYQTADRAVDLNYRIDLPDSEVRQLISGGLEIRDYNIRDMLAYDQLTRARSEGKAFEGFREGRITHLPTYRFGAGIATDDNGYDIKRRPAWTDRILYLPSPHIRIKQTSYTAQAEMTMSDHRPISADFSVGVWEADASVYNDCAWDFINQLRELRESEETPKLKVDFADVQFGHVWYMREASQQLILQNAGKGVILPNESKSLSLTVFVDNESAPALNLGHEQLQHMLILHTQHGKDHFITVTGEYQRSCFATDLSALVRLPGPIRNLKRREPLAIEQVVNAPREIIRLINWLMTNAVDVPKLFLARGESLLLETIRECLDSGAEFEFDPSTDKEKLCLSFANVLILFLQFLPQPMIPPFLHRRCVLAADRDEAFEIISTELPSSHLNVWISLTAFLHCICQQTIGQMQVGGINNTQSSKAESLACIFAPILFRDDFLKNMTVSPLSKRRFLLHFIL